MLYSSLHFYRAMVDHSVSCRLRSWVSEWSCHHELEMFILLSSDGRFVVLESSKNPGQRIGVTPEGKVKLAYNVGMGQDSKLIPVQHVSIPL